MKEMITISGKEGRFEITAVVCPMGNDLLVVFSGGLEHIGAVGMAEPRPSLKDMHRISSTGSVFTFPGHKEDVLAKSFSEELAKRLNRKIVVVAGIHWDDLNGQEIKVILDICGRLKEAIITRMAKGF